MVHKGLKRNAITQLVKIYQTKMMVLVHTLTVTLL